MRLDTVSVHALEFLLGYDGLTLSPMCHRLPLGPVLQRDSCVQLCLNDSSGATPKQFKYPYFSFLVVLFCFSSSTSHTYPLLLLFYGFYFEHVWVLLWVFFSLKITTLDVGADLRSQWDAPSNVCWCCYFKPCSTGMLLFCSVLFSVGIQDIVAHRSAWSFKFCCCQMPGDSQGNWNSHYLWAGSSDPFQWAEPWHHPSAWHCLTASPRHLRPHCSEASQSSFLGCSFKYSSGGAQSS